MKQCDQLNEAIAFVLALPSLLAGVKRYTIVSKAQLAFPNVKIAIDLVKQEHAALKVDPTLTTIQFINCFNNLSHEKKMLVKRLNKIAANLIPDETIAQLDHVDLRNYQHAQATIEA